MSNRISWLASRAPIALLTVAAACGSGGGSGNSVVTPTNPTPPSSVLSSINVTLSATTLQIGQTATATATGLDQNGATTTLSGITWTSSNQNVATVSQNGTVTAVAAGTALITATSSGKSGSTTVAVIVGPTISSVAVTLSATSAAQGQTARATATAIDQNGGPIPSGGVTWTSSNTTVATIDSTGLITALSPGTTTITGRIDGHAGTATFTVTTVPVASVSVSPTSFTLNVGATQLMTATVRDASGTVLTGRQIAWSSSDPTKATVSPTGTVQAIAAGVATIVATSEGKSASATVTVAAAAPAPACSPATATQPAVGDVRPLTAAQIASLCVTGGGAASEYVLIPFNNSSVASTTTQIELSATGTVGVTTSPNVRPTAPGGLALDRSIESAFRMRERRDIGALRTRSRLPHALITGVPAVPAVGSIVTLNSNVSGNTCTDPKVMHQARVVAVTTHAIVFLDNTAPAGGYTDAELTAFATAFDTLGFVIDTTNFGAPTDIDSNGRVGIFFTPGINQIPGPVGGVIGGLFAARDLFPASTTGCTASNEGEMFYMPVPDPNSTINGNYTNKAFVASLVEPTLAHEFQHLINAGRRIYINNAAGLEQIWLNEGLSHIAEELLYFHQSGNGPLQNIDLPRIQSSQTQVNAFNNDESQNFGRFSTYLSTTASNSPYALVDGLGMRGAIWSLLRYAADQKGGSQRNTWFALVNSTTNGEANFDAVFGDIVSTTRNWAVANFLDDIGFPVPPQYTQPSWSFRSVYPGLSTKKFPLFSYQLVAGTPVTLSIVGGGTAYVRFGVGAGVAANIAATSQGQAVPPNMDFILVRTK